jgi:acetyltransferase-like isoleucine patch superfamily enzyme
MRATQPYPPPAESRTKRSPVGHPARRWTDQPARARLHQPPRVGDQLARRWTDPPPQRTVDVPREWWSERPGGRAAQPARIRSWHRDACKLLVVRVMNYVTNHVVAHIPSFVVRHTWYRRALGIRMGRHAAVHLGCYVWFYGPGGTRRTGASIGANTWISRDSTLDVRGGLHIGDNVSVSPEVTILTASKQPNDPRFGTGHSPVTIENHVWIGTRAMILPGVTLGRGSVVAAGAVVTRDVPPLAIVAGTPARIVGARDGAATGYVLDEALPLLE